MSIDIRSLASLSNVGFSRFSVSNHNRHHQRDRVYDPADLHSFGMVLLLSFGEEVKVTS